MATEPLISHVSDTARWVATYRAIESDRPDALFDDPLAGRLAGERGRAIVAEGPRALRNGWWLVARTKVIDDVILEAIGDGCDKVLNLAAGLDTRPYRLELPPDFPWVEADLPDLLAEKQQALADQTPRCRLARHAVDLADPAARDAFLAEELAGVSRALVLTEGLLMYLDQRDVVSLATALKRPEVAWWMLDFSGPGLQKRLNKRSGGLLDSAPFRFAPENGVAFFEDLGWRAIEIESVFTVARRVNRLPRWMRPLAWLPQPDPRKPGNNTYSGVVRFAQA
ncbi:SAM-dependent methyltransferase [Mycobacterium sp. 3519A]|jgi:methyltransferase (TIGR00027 family)|uniref:class I SAM-dependent methyltransferase n=1 Tax=Mycobacterium sp. 3519A TaxID=2057184 RepID=UPI000C7C164D|nr:SAM-dependent methyltransferase [Mycobacterium sp. 3519A]